MADDYSTPRVSRHRKHVNGDHSECIPHGKCPEATRLSRINGYRLLNLAVFAELKVRGIDPVTFYGDKYDVAKRLAEFDMPDYDYLDREPDRIHQLQARDFIAGGIPPIDERSVSEFPVP